MSLPCTLKKFSVCQTYRDCQTCQDTQEYWNSQKYKDCRKFRDNPDYWEMPHLRCGYIEIAKNIDYLNFLHIKTFLKILINSILLNVSIFCEFAQYIRKFAKVPHTTFNFRKGAKIHNQPHLKTEPLMPIFSSALTRMINGLI